MKDESLSQATCKNCSKPITREGKRRYCSYECLYAYHQRFKGNYHRTYLEKKKIVDEQDKEWEKQFAKRVEKKMMKEQRRKEKDVKKENDESKIKTTTN